MSSLQDYMGEAGRFVRYAVMVIVVVGVSAVLGVSAVVGYQVFLGDDSQLKKSTILARINEETTIYTLDEQTRIGSFFDEGHRTYVPIDDVPDHVIRAMVAAEDKNFYNHFGIDPVAIFTAFADGVKSGFKFHRGGSTLTQQTVKNILDRRDRTFKRKFKEMIRSLQLERMYSKQQILEFYLNQFHVTSNGKGIGIAAQHYFNKKVSDLTLVEGAFIAGSVKAPNKYNPFTKFTKEAREQAWAYADERKNYVLRRMYEQGWVTKDELEKAWNERVPFSQGKFSTEEVALVSMIRSQMNRKEILDALNMESINELDNAGLKIYTTIDAELQSEAQLMMRRNLSRLEIVLEGFSVEPQDRFRSQRSLEKNQYVYGRVAKILSKNGRYELNIDFGIPKGVIPADSMERTAKLLNLPDYRGYQVHLKEMMEKIKIGSTLFAEVIDFDPKTHDAILELRKYPTVNGGIIAVDKGEVRALVSGFEPKGYNRALFATRQPGSVFKSVVYFGALQLGWSILDRLDNERNIFPFQGQFYYPRPDHNSPYMETSMIWAGTKSENLASIYLAVNLLDKLNFGQYKALMRKMELLPIVGESPADYHYRVAKETGVQLDNDGIREHLLKKAIMDLKPDMIFSGRFKLMQKISKMWWGRGYLAELQRVAAFDPKKGIPESEYNLRIDLVKNNFKRLGDLAAAMPGDWETVAGQVAKGGADSVLADPVMKTIVEHFRVLGSTGGTPELAYVRVLPGEESASTTKSGDGFATEPIPGRALNALDIQSIWNGGGILAQKADINIDDVMLGGYLPMRYYKKVQQAIESRYQSVMAKQDKYSLYQYFNHHDFRIILGLKYLVDLSHTLGVFSPLEPVQSYPLGTNAVSVAEVAKIYQTFTEGKTYTFYEEGPPNQLNVIRRIEDRDGNVLFEPKRREFQVVDPCITSQMVEILNKVVTHGTGGRARGELQIILNAPQNYVQIDADAISKKEGINIRVPAYGKTGTTNDYTTAYFAGFLPYPTEPKKPLNISSSYTIASYVGYDMNKTMRRGPYLITGAQGALPVWSDFAKSIIEKKHYIDNLDTLDINTISRHLWPTTHSNCTSPVNVDLPTGSLLGNKSPNDVEVFGSTNFQKEGETSINEFERDATVNSFIYLASKIKDGYREPNRIFSPYSEPKVTEPPPQVDPDAENVTGLEDAYDGGEGVSSAPGSLNPAPAAAAAADVKPAAGPEAGTPKAAPPAPAPDVQPTAKATGAIAAPAAVEPPQGDGKAEKATIVKQPPADIDNKAPAKGSKSAPDDSGLIDEELW